MQWAERLCKRQPGAGPCYASRREGPATYYFWAETGDEIACDFDSYPGWDEWETYWYVFDAAGAVICAGGQFATGEYDCVAEANCAPTGACCDDHLALCWDDRLLAGCTGTRWAEAALCSDLQPTCGAYLACLHRIDLYDSYGDGWNDNTLDLYVGGRPVFLGLTLATGGGPQSHTFQAAAGDEIATAYHASGDWRDEPYYLIWDGLGGPIVQDGGDFVPPTGVTVSSRCPAAPQLGDLNCDGAVNAFDIDPFVLALTDAEGYVAAAPDCFRLLADCNGDGQVNAFDIDPFVRLLTGG